MDTNIKQTMKDEMLKIKNDPVTDLPEGVKDQVIELTELTIKKIDRFWSTRHIGMIVETDQLKAAIHAVMPYNDRALELLKLFEENTAVVLMAQRYGPAYTYRFA